MLGLALLSHAACWMWDGEDLAGGSRSSFSGRVEDIKIQMLGKKGIMRHSPGLFTGDGFCCM